MRVYKTIANGDCMFAAFAMAYSHKDLTYPMQKKAAAAVRKQVADHLATTPGYILGPPLEARDMERLPARGISDSNLRNAMDNHGNIQKYIAAYARIIGTPRVWGGGIELSALSDLYEVEIVIFSETDNYTVGERHASNGRVYLWYEGGIHYSAMF
jgi:cell wall-associated NlpC family hydrolase